MIFFGITFQNAYEEATRLRNQTYETLADEEKKLSEVRRAREIELEELRLVPGLGAKFGTLPKLDRKKAT